MELCMLYRVMSHYQDGISWCSPWSHGIAVYCATKHCVIEILMMIFLMRDSCSWKLVTQCWQETHLELPWYFEHPKTRIWWNSDLSRCMEVPHALICRPFGICLSFLTIIPSFLSIVYLHDWQLELCHFVALSYNIN